MHKETALIHRFREPARQYGAMNPPIVHASTIAFETLDDLENLERFRTSYGTHGTETHFGLLDTLVEMEGGVAGHLLPSGLAAGILPLLALLEGGDHLLMPENCYQPFRRFTETALRRMRVETEYYAPGADEAEIADRLRPDTRVLFLESPGSDTFEVVDTAALSALARRAGVTTVMDATWSAGYLFKPLQHGVDISIQALTKYVSGHSDCLLGSVICAEETRFKAIDTAHAVYGMGYGAPEEAYLAARGLRTMAVRLARQQQSGLAVATWLEEHPEVIKVHYPALPSHSGHALWKRDYTGASSLFSFELPSRPRAALAAMLDNLEFFSMGYSWGGYESLIVPKYPHEIRPFSGWPNDHRLLRLHIGLENSADLIADLEAGLKRYLA